MVDAERPITVVNAREQGPRRHSAWPHLYVELSTGKRKRLLADRGWSGSGEIADEGLASIEHTARMVVGPDGPGRGDSDE